MKKKNLELPDREKKNFVALGCLINILSFVDNFVEMN